MSVPATRPANPTKWIEPREAARRLGIPDTTLGYWTRQGWVKVLRPAQGTGQPAQLDWGSVQACYKLRKRLDPRHRKREQSRRSR